ncbi:MAG: sigma-70 family RNA polymerase sigma factor [Propionibacteriales bacterium]|nr:sigma-70 family RNA polymerase sigma factor [Propionibacteriales bacterium]
MNELQRTALLTAEEEQSLARDIEVGLLAAEARATGRRPGGATEVELELLAEAGHLARQRFVEANLGLVGMIVRRYAARSPLPEDDLFQEGVIGLAEAVERFDHCRGVRFATYAISWIRARVALLAATSGGRLQIPATRAAQLRRLRFIENELTLRLGRTPTRPELREAFGDGDLTLLDELSHLSPPQSLDGLDWYDVPDVGSASTFEVGLCCEALRAVLARLRPRERIVIEARYGFGRPCATYGAIAASLDTSPSTVRRLEARALDNLRGLVTTDMRPQAA